MEDSKLAPIDDEGENVNALDKRNPMLDELLQFCEKNDEDNEACEAFLEYWNTIKNEVCDGISTGVDSGYIRESILCLQ